LDLGVGNKGFLLPRVELISVTDVVTVTNPAQGLIVFNTNATITGGAGIGFYYWSASKWNKILTEELEATGWQLTGNAGINPTIHYIGTTDNQPLSIRTNGIQRILVDSDGNVYITNNTEITGTLSVLNATNNNTFSTSSSQAVDIAYIFPLAQGTADSYLKNDGSGNLTWGTLSGSSNWTPKIGQARLETNDPDWGLVSGGGNAATRAVALGNQTQAQGSNSVALGNLTQATGYAATALGHQTTATANALLLWAKILLQADTELLLWGHILQPLLLLKL
jgi:hypothetical protein